MRWGLAGLLVVCALFVAAFTPGTASAAVCADYSTQAEAQAAADTKDADGDGIYCESLPCPCSSGGGSNDGASDPPPPPPKPKPSCVKTTKTVKTIFSSAKYPNIKKHFLDAVAKGWPRVMVLNRKNADKRRDRLLEGIPTMDGFDRDEYPAAVGRGRPNGKAKGLVRGINPRGWMADVMYVPSSENRSHGSSLGAKLRKYCNGTKFRYVFN